jgi:RNA polymerase sigma-70 factor (ECF subfamily)
MDRVGERLDDLRKIRVETGTERDMRKRAVVAAGDETSADAARFRSLYEANIREVTAYCARRVSTDRVDDAVAETFLVVWRRIADVPDGDASRLWMYQVAYRIVGREWRGNARRNRLGRRLRSVRPVAPHSPEETVVAGDDTGRVVRAAARLNPSDAEILRLVAWDRLAASEIATVLGLSPNAVHQRIHRAKKNLAVQLDRLDRLDHHGPERRAIPEGGPR